MGVVPPSLRFHTYCPIQYQWAAFLPSPVVVVVVVVVVVGEGSVVAVRPGSSVQLLS